MRRGRVYSKNAQILRQVYAKENALKMMENLRKYENIAGLKSIENL